MASTRSLTRTMYAFVKTCNRRCPKFLCYFTTSVGTSWLGGRPFFKSTACEAMPNTAFRNTCHIYTVQKSFTQRRHSEGFHTQRARRKHFFAANCEFCLFCCTFLMSSMAAASTELSTGCQKIYIKKKLFSRALVDMYTSEEFIYF